MGERSPALTPPAPVTPTISNRRLLIEMAVFVIVATIVAIFPGGTRAGIGVLFGGALAFVNYYWLKRSTAALFSGVSTPLSAGLLSLRFISRYAAVGAIILAVHFSGLLPAVAVIAGLAAFAAAVVIEGSISIFRRTI